MSTPGILPNKQILPLSKGSIDDSFITKPKQVLTRNSVLEGFRDDAFINIHSKPPVEKSFLSKTGDYIKNIPSTLKSFPSTFKSLSTLKKAGVVGLGVIGLTGIVGIVMAHEANNARQDAELEAQA